MPPRFSTARDSRAGSASAAKWKNGASGAPSPPAASRAGGSRRPSCSRCARRSRDGSPIWSVARSSGMVRRRSARARRSRRSRASATPACARHRRAPPRRSARRAATSSAGELAQHLRRRQAPRREPVDAVAAARGSKRLLAEREQPERPRRRAVGPLDERRVDAVRRGPRHQADHAHGAQSIRARSAPATLD